MSLEVVTIDIHEVGYRTQDLNDGSKTPFSVVTRECFHPHFLPDIKSTIAGTLVVAYSLSELSTGHLLIHGGSEEREKSTRCTSEEEVGWGSTSSRMGGRAVGEEEALETQRQLTMRSFQSFFKSSDETFSFSVGARVVDGGGGVLDPVQLTETSELGGHELRSIV